MSNADTIIAALTDAPGATAQELGTNVPTMALLEQAGRVIRIGSRSTGKRGRPPVEWAIAGADVEIAPRISQAQDEARQRVEAFRKWSRGIAAYDQAVNLGMDPGVKPKMPEVPKDADFKVIGESRVVTALTEDGEDA